MNQKQAPLQRQNAEIGVTLDTVLEDSAKEAKRFQQRETESILWDAKKPMRQLGISWEDAFTHVEGTVGGSTLLMRCLCRFPQEAEPEKRACIRTGSLIWKVNEEWGTDKKEQRMRKAYTSVCY